jgi:hypothetical protein
MLILGYRFKDVIFSSEDNFRHIKGDINMKGFPYRNNQP